MVPQPTSTGSTHSIGAATGPASGESARQWPRCQPAAVPASPGWRCSWYHSQPDRGLHVIGGGAGLLAAAPEAFGARCRRNLTLAHKLGGIELGQESVHAELLHSVCRAPDAIAIPLPDRGAEVCVRRLLRLRGWV